MAASQTRRAVFAAPAALLAAPLMPGMFPAPARPAAVNPVAAAGAWIKEYRSHGGSFAVLNGDIYFGSVYPPAPEIEPLQGQLEGSLYHYVKVLVREAHRRGVV